MKYWEFFDGVIEPIPKEKENTYKVGQRELVFKHFDVCECCGSLIIPPSHSFVSSENEDNIMLCETCFQSGRYFRTDRAKQVSDLYKTSDGTRCYAKCIEIKDTKFKELE